MTIAEFIEKLKKLDPKRKIVFQGQFNACTEFKIIYYKDGKWSDTDKPGYDMIIDGIG